jgi:hypothetical protein
VADVARLQDEGRSLIRRGVHDQDGYTLIIGKKPNTHGLLELVLHTLPALRNATFADCRPFETKHGPNKAAGGARRGGRGGGYGEITALKWSRRRLCLRGLLLNRTWFSSDDEVQTLTHSLSPNLLTLRDYRKGKAHNAHPLLQRITGSLEVVGDDPACLRWDAGEAGWRPKALTTWRSAEWLPTKQTSLWIIPPGEVAHLLPEARRDRGLPVPAVTSHFEYCVVWKAYRDVGARRFWVHVGDDVEVHLHDREGASSWCRVRQIIVVRHSDGLHRMWVIPSWYCSTIDEDGDIYRRHRLRGTPLVRKLELGPDDHDFKPILADEVQVQVCVTHSCIRQGHLQTCGVRTFCQTHHIEFNPELGCRHGGCVTYLKDVHNLERRAIWEIINRESGMSGCSTRGFH